MDGLPIELQSKILSYLTTTELRAHDWLLLRLCPGAEYVVTNHVELYADYFNLGSRSEKYVPGLIFTHVTLYEIPAYLRPTYVTRLNIQTDVPLDFLTSFSRLNTLHVKALIFTDYPSTLQRLYVTRVEDKIPAHVEKIWSDVIRPTMASEHSSFYRRIFPGWISPFQCLTNRSRIIEIKSPIWTMSSPQQAISRIHRHSTHYNHGLQLETTIPLPNVLLPPPRHPRRLRPPPRHYPPARRI